MVYCALDREFAEPILDQFSKETGLKVVARWDTEANKSVGLYEDLLREKERPRCDVHWNNEILATIRLQRQGVLAPYESPSAQGFPAAFRAPDHSWTGFAARARILIVNTSVLPKKADWPTSVMACTEPRWRGKFAMARPQFGTTATQAACLFHMLGNDRAKDFFRQVKENRVALLPGNKQVAVAVGMGKFAFGLTDTDDAYAEIDAGNPVAIVFPDLQETPWAPGEASKLTTLFIPNTAALIKNCPNPAGGKRLIDYVLRQDIEAKLAQGASRQIPLNPAAKMAALEIALPNWEHYGRMVDFEKVVDRWEEAQRFLAAEFAGR